MQYEEKQLACEEENIYYVDCDKRRVNMIRDLTFLIDVSKQIKTKMADMGTQDNSCRLKYIHINR